MSAEPYLTNIARNIQLSVAPVFLLTAIGTTIAVLTSRLGRIVDRARILEERIASVPAQGGASIQTELAALSKRAKLINLAITLGTVCALLICIMIASMFIGVFLSLDLAVFVALLFVTAMLVFVGALLAFLREVFVAVKALRIVME
ncbi:MAG TPA: DUF2721 domain-containing protein [Nitrospirota bacterium]|nr:DUF2721 domain-containing protein [Nitrospirota bacterium]